MLLFCFLQLLARWGLSLVFWKRKEWKWRISFFRRQRKPKNRMPRCKAKSKKAFHMALSFLFPRKRKLISVNLYGRLLSIRKSLLLVCFWCPLGRRESLLCLGDVPKTRYIPSSLSQLYTVGNVYTLTSCTLSCPIISPMPHIGRRTTSGSDEPWVFRRDGL